ncbi:MAG: terminase small subunit [Bacillota bacterium]|nr:terminase small subunit [Bacillota bacterium]
MAAAVGNQYALGCTNSGRPAKYKTPEEMQIVIDKYFEDCKGEMLINKETGEPILNKYDDPIYTGAKPPTITGLALALGFNTRLSLLNYQDKKEFMNTISQAKSRIEEYAETRLFDRDGVNGAKFSLTNNFKGWKETQGIEITGADGGPILLNQISALSDADLKQLEEIMARSQIQGEIVDIEPSE